MAKETFVKVICDLCNKEIQSSTSVPYEVKICNIGDSIETLDISKLHYHGDYRKVEDICKPCMADILEEAVWRLRC